MEEIPMLQTPRLLRSIEGFAIQSGRFIRKGEQIEYVVKRDEKLLYLRYRGNKMFVSTWQSVLFEYVQEGRNWCQLFTTCPFCGSPTEELYIWIRNLRCTRCFRYRARWDRQMRSTRKIRRKIEKGDLLSVAEGLVSESPDEMYMAMVAMEMSGLSNRKLTSELTAQVWKRIPDKR
jgi:hypothetical protein